MIQRARNQRGGIVRLHIQVHVDFYSGIKFRKRSHVTDVEVKQFWRDPFQRPIPYFLHTHCLTEVQTSSDTHTFNELTRSSLSPR